MFVDAMIVSYFETLHNDIDFT